MDAALAPVDGEVLVGVALLLLVRRRLCGAAEQRLDARDELLLAEGLHDVVVGAGLEAADPLELVAAGREHQDGHGRHVADAVEDVPAVELRHGDVEHDEIGPPGVELAKPLAPVRGVVDGDSGALEEGHDELTDVVVVVHDEHAGFAHTSFIPSPSAVHPSSDEIAAMATILIADPDPATRSLLEVLVLRLGHRPIGQWELAEDETPDLMLLEPASRAGMRHARRLRSRFPEMPILCVSIDPPCPELAELGVAGHVMKPFRRSQLEEALDAVLIPAPETSRFGI